jgi:hypothetical protein
MDLKKQAQEDEILTVAELAARWKLGKDMSPIWRAVDKPEGALPHLYLGTGTARSARRRGKRGLYRFRLSDVVRWEADSRRTFEKDHQAEDARSVEALKGINGFDGKNVLVRRGKRGPRNAVAAK